MARTRARGMGIPADVSAYFGSMPSPRIGLTAALARRTLSPWSDLRAYAAMRGGFVVVHDRRARVIVARLRIGPPSHTTSACGRASSTSRTLVVSAAGVNGF